MAALILDASVLIGLLDTAAAHHHRAVEDVDGADSTGDTLLVPASAHSEALVSFAHKSRSPPLRAVDRRGEAKDGGHGSRWGASD